MREFYERVSKEEKKFGWRTEQAMGNGGIDWKALSHAVRVIHQCDQLYNEGTITFPLKQREEILKIKQGEYGFDEVSDVIINGLNKIDKLKENSKYSQLYKYDHEFFVDLIKEFYVERELEIEDEYYDSINRDLDY